MPIPSKLTSPPTVPSREDAAIAISNVCMDGQRKRVNGPMLIPSSTEWMQEHAMDDSVKKLATNDEELCDLLAPSSSSTGSMVHIGGWRVRLRDIMFAIAFVGGLTTIGFIMARHAHAHTRPHKSMRLDGTDDSDNALLAALTSKSKITSRATAIATLNDELDVLRPLDVRRSINGELNTTIRVAAKHFTDGPIAFWTRAYEQSIPGPVWSVHPGDTINYHLINELEPNMDGDWAENTYHNPNSTNIHVHGMHVDPTGIADNVLREAKPGETLFSSIPIPKHHPRGLYHYHPHYHGSIYVQLGGGMSGPILVEDDDTTLPDEYKDMKKLILSLQEFNYEDLRDIDKAAHSTMDDHATYTTKSLLDAYVRTLYPDVHLATSNLNLPLSSSLLAQLSFAQVKPTEQLYAPPISRFFTVNGQFLPKIEVQPHENVLLRLLNAGASALLELSVPGCTFHQIAADGMYMPAPPRPMDVLLLSPGARADIVMNCKPNDPTVGPKGESLRPLQSIKHDHLKDFVGTTSDVFRGILAFIHVSGPSRAMPLVKTTPPAPAMYANDNLLELSEPEETAIQSFPFEFTMGMNLVMKDGFPYKLYYVNHALFNMTSIRNMPLGQIQEWVLINKRYEPMEDQPPMLTYSNHPFHLHTNAFQIVAMSHGEGVDYKVGDWRDVVAIPTPGNVTIRFRPVDFRGPALAHCHAAAHSDSGMLALAMYL